MLNIQIQLQIPGDCWLLTIRAKAVMVEVF